MAPTKGSSKGASSGGDSKGSKPSTLSSASRVSKSSKNVKRPPPQEVKSKARTAPENLAKKKKRVYTEAELDLPKLNTITPVGVVKPKGKKKGKTFVDDQEGMMTILAMVNAEKEGQIESKMMKARQLEEIRQARKAEAEARQAQKKSKLDAAKDAIRNKKKAGKGGNDKSTETSTDKNVSKSSKPKRKSVSFA
ncbi:60S ribosomal subunit assembly/export protein loc1 [Penicillium hispanicum]|uniref:60S ribosomal subunit assembly/export protein loc1 n=1 Tax=Penicillium hispanicum TaxID=1080232 RepID=UPI002541EA8B|nr:60S ribosomal subunit assembly/export protein loc1 [Penicillium hispanicum]KAJ5570272.1 60S ribosomal subunit assembly/export protein loc1 [Penicillium hispanicum]